MKSIILFSCPKGTEFSTLLVATHPRRNEVERIELRATIFDGDVEEALMAAPNLCREGEKVINTIPI